MKTQLLFFLLISVRINLQAQPAIQWQKCLGGTDNDFAYSIHQTTDGGYIAAGYTLSNNGNVTGNHGNEDFWVMKLDSSGNLLWQKCLGGTDNEQVNEVQQTADGGYIVAGFTMSNNGDVSGNHGNEDCWVVKLNSGGTIQWQKCLGGTERDYANAVQQTSDGGYIIAGYTYSNNGDVSGNHGSDDYWVVKLDGSGNLQWQKCFGGTESEYANSVQQTVNGGYLVAGYTYSNNGDVSGNHGSYDSWVIELSSSGNLLWQKCLGGTRMEYTYSVRQITGGNIIVAGSTGSNDGDVSGNHNTSGFGFEWDQWIVLLSSSGNLQWQKCLGGTDQDIAFSVQQTIDGGFVVGGNAWSMNGNVISSHGNSDFWVVKLDINGNIQWQKCLGGSSFEMARSIQQTSDGGYIVAGFTLSNNGDVSGNHGNYDAWIVKLFSISTPLPVQLITFTGEAKTNYNILKWITASEYNNKGFEIERSNSGVGIFETVGFVPGFGTSTTANEYSFRDYQADRLNYYYRLKQNDFNGEFVYSHMILVKCGMQSEKSWNVMPNPFNDHLFIHTTNETVKIRLLDLKGKLLWETNKNTIKALPEFIIKSLDEGTYAIHFFDESSFKNEVLKVVKVK